MLSFRKLMTGGRAFCRLKNTARYCHLHNSSLACRQHLASAPAKFNPPRDLGSTAIALSSSWGQTWPKRILLPLPANAGQEKGASTWRITIRVFNTNQRGLRSPCKVIRPATDVAFINAVIRYTFLEHDLWFHEYVLHYTNAATLINPGFFLQPENRLVQWLDEAKNASRG